MLAGIKKVFKVLFVIYIVLYGFVWLASPTVVRYFLTDYLSTEQLQLAEQTSIRYNPFLSHLSIRDLAISKKGNASQEANEPVASLKTLDLEVRLYEFIFDELYISEFIIDGLYLNVSTTDELVEVAGFPVVTADDNTASENEIAEIAPEEKSAQNSQVSEFPYKLNLPKLTLTDSLIELFVNQSPHRLKLQKLSLTDLDATLASQHLLLAIDSEVNTSKLSLTLEANMDNGQGEFDIELGLNKIKLARFQHFLPEDIQALAGQLSYQGKHFIRLNGSDITVEMEKLALSVEALSLKQNDLHFQLAEQKLTSNALKLTLLQEQQKQVVEGDALLSLSAFKVFHLQQEQVLAQFEQLNVDGIKLSVENEVNAIAIAAVNLEKAVFSDDVSNEIPALAAFELLNINQINASEKGVDVAGIHLSGLVVDAQLNKEKVLVNLVELPANDELDENVDETAKASEVNKIENKNENATLDAEQPSFALKLGEFSFTDDAHIFFQDQSVDPIYKRSITITKLTAGAFDNQQPDLESLYSLMGKSEKYAHFDFSGKMKPFLSLPFYSLKGAFKEVSLPSISPYIKDSLQYEIESGQLDLALDVSLTGSELDGDANILLRGIEFTAADDHESGSIKDQTSVPFNVALGMLKDSDGNVDLSLPLSGDVSSPDFGLTGLMTLLVKQATMSAAKDYLMTTFVPYASVVNIALAAGEFALKVRFNDLAFPAEEVELQDSHEQFLTQFAALLKDKDDVQVKLCAIATPTDIGKKQGVEITDKKLIKQLAELSEQRIHAFKDHMVEKEGISSSRLLLCKPQIDTSVEGKPRISFET